MNKKIIVAEDFNVSRKIIVSVLTKLGHTVMEASNGLEAVSLFDGRPVDLLITDFNMPEMNGAELIKTVRAHDEYAYIPILLLTTEVNEQKIKMALDENITAWIKKPFQTDEFLKIVNKALR
ncbi:response regulator [Fulvivirga ulvae]|uniref:response regulator n=1 Tax=Fulvivirga ulvae TaxID=2904245 RepID=UPI001F1DE065|nr:response regulator [Fulvivirga ulvae]UII31220.1 response regulator [Fulvivirga ulvae]